MKRKDFFYITALLLSVSIALWAKFDKDEIAFIRTRELIEKYEGMKEATENFNNQINKYNSKKDSLQVKFNLEIENYKKDSLSYTREEKIKKKELLRHLQYSLYSIEEKIKTYAAEQDQKMMVQVLNQLNSFITQYGKKHGYKIIFGTLETGNVMYGDEAIDITDEIIEKINKYYFVGGQQ